MTITSRSRVLGAATGAAASLMLTAAVVAHASKARRTIVYEDIGRTAFSKFVANEVYDGNVMPGHPLSFQRSNVFFGEVLGYPVRNCSTSKYRCVAFGFQVLAVPKARLVRGQTYVVSGATLTVEDCFRGEKDVCQVALIKSVCEATVKDGAALKCARSAQGSRAIGRTTPMAYFIYNEDIGVTGWGRTMRAARTRRARLSIASEMILQGKIGLLGAGWLSRP